MAGFKSVVHLTSKAAVLVLVIALMVQSQSSRAQSQSCSSELSSLNVCAPFVVPGNSANPSTECCGALQGVQHDCLCSTLRIASQLPSRCNLSPTSCGLLILLTFSLLHFCSPKSPFSFYNVFVFQCLTCRYNLMNELGLMCVVLFWWANNVEVFIFWFSGFFFLLCQLLSDLGVKRA